MLAWPCSGRMELVNTPPLACRCSMKAQQYGSIWEGVPSLLCPIPFPHTTSSNDDPLLPLLVVYKRAKWLPRLPGPIQHE